MEHFQTAQPKVLETIEQARMELVKDFEEMAQYLYKLNLCLLHENDLLRFYQPKSHGSVLLEQSKCSKHTRSCCPHSKWKKWETPVNKNLKLPHHFVPSRVTTPVQSLKRTGEHAKHHELCKAVVQQAKKQIKVRDKLWKQIKDMKHTISGNQHLLDMDFDITD